MKFEFLVALKYLIPRFRYLSVSIISLISVIVISLVVWLVIVFLSVTNGIEKKWVDELVSLNAPIRITPTEAYYQSYYYLIDQISDASNYEAKTIGEKLSSEITDPYNPLLDAELPKYFPQPDLDANGSAKDLVKKLWECFSTLPFKDLKAQDYEVAFGNLRLNIIRDEAEDLFSHEESSTTFLSQVSYISSIDSSNPKLQKMLLKPRVQDLKHLYSKLGLATSSIEDQQIREISIEESDYKNNLAIFLKNVKIHSLTTPSKGWLLSESFIPKQGSLKALGVLINGKIQKIFIPSEETHLVQLQKKIQQAQFTSINGEVLFSQDGWKFQSNEKISIADKARLYLAPNISFRAFSLKEPSLDLQIQTIIQGQPFSGIISLNQLEIESAEAITDFQQEPQIPPFWVYQSKGNTIPSHNIFGDGILLSKTFQNNGVCIGDRGYLAFFTPSGSSVQEQRLPIYVAGFYDQGLMPIGSKLIFADPKTVAALRGNISIADKSLGNGIHLRFANLDQTETIKSLLLKEIEKNGLTPYWTVESYSDFEFSKPLLQQLKSDKTLFTLIGIIILFVACSNIVSMLILLVNDKKKEIGILQSLGASSKSIALIFGLCGFITGLLSCLIGTIAALLTLFNLGRLVSFLSFIQGHDVFQSAFYGSSLPNELSLDSLLFVILATITISLLAGIAPAIKACLLKPSQILRGE